METYSSAIQEVFWAALTDAATLSLGLKPRFTKTPITTLGSPSWLFPLAVGRDLCDCLWYSKELDGGISFGQNVFFFFSISSL
jgi:hypothetical protein